MFCPQGLTAVSDGQFTGTKNNALLAFGIDGKAIEHDGSLRPAVAEAHVLMSPEGYLAALELYRSVIYLQDAYGRPLGSGSVTLPSYSQYMEMAWENGCLLLRDYQKEFKIDPSGKVFVRVPHVIDKFIELAQTAG
jgi:hypothetical protein